MEWIFLKKENLQAMLTFLADISSAEAGGESSINGANKEMNTD